MAILSGFPSGVSTANIAVPKMVRIAGTDGVMYHFDGEHKAVGSEAVEIGKCNISEDKTFEMEFSIVHILLRANAEEVDTVADIICAAYDNGFVGESSVPYTIGGGIGICTISVEVKISEDAITIYASIKNGDDNGIEAAGCYAILL